MGLQSLVQYISNLLQWGIHSFLTISLACILIMVSAQGKFFLHSYPAHCALVYVIAKHIVNRVQSIPDYDINKKKQKSMREERTDWKDGKKRVILTSLGIVHECLVLAMIPQKWLRFGKED
tara:strand:+ start:18982 stop:19344 length:363 start_codon:yes stop_codon:yes gene_type:complete